MEKFMVYVHHFLAAVAGNFYWSEKKRLHSTVSGARIQPPGDSHKLVRSIPAQTEAFGVLIAENFFTKWENMEKMKAENDGWAVLFCCCVACILLSLLS